MNELLKIKNPKIIKLIEFLKNKIKGTSYEKHVFLVGGCVRDAILGRDCEDVDVVVDILNGEVGLSNWLTIDDESYMKDANPAIFPTYGTASFYLLNQEDFKDIEIQCVHTCRLQEKGSKLAFGTVEEDALKRDLTINALYYNISTDEILDPTHMGLNDIKNHILRTPSDSVLKDDPCRILRIIRFSNLLNWGIEKNTWMSMIRNSYEVLKVPQSRITNELNKILITDSPSKAIIRMLCCNNLLNYVLPGVSYQQHIWQSKFPKETVLEHTLKVLDAVEPKIENRLAALFHDVGKILTYKKGYANHASEGATFTQKMMGYLKYPKPVIKDVVTAISLHEVFSMYKDKQIPSKKLLRKFRNYVGNNYDLTMDLIDANNKTQYYGKKLNQVMLIKEAIRTIEIKEKKNLTTIKLPVNGNDIKDYFKIKSGPTVGKALKIIKDAYFENPDITKEQCFELISKNIK